MLTKFQMHVQKFSFTPQGKKALGAPEQTGDKEQDGVNADTGDHASIFRWKPQVDAQPPVMSQAQVLPLSAGFNRCTAFC